MIIPSDWKKSEKKKVKASIDMSEEVAGQGLCPNCRQPMAPVIANKMHCMYCPGCRIVLPTKNENK